MKARLDRVLFIFTRRSRGESNGGKQLKTKAKVTTDQVGRLERGATQGGAVKSPEQAEKVVTRETVNPV